MRESCPRCGHSSGGGISYVGMSCSECETEACDMCLIRVGDDVLCSQCMRRELRCLRIDAEQLRRQLDDLKPTRGANYQFCNLPAPVRVEIADRLGLLDPAKDLDLQMPRRVFARAKQAGCLAKLEEAIADATAALARENDDG